MQLASMELTAKEAKEESGLSTASEDLPKYPYGLCIDLCDEALQKLGITEMPPVGSTMQLLAKVEVTRVSAYENQDGKEASLGLQITDLALSAPTGGGKGSRSASEIASSLYS